MTENNNKDLALIVSESEVHVNINGCDIINWSSYFISNDNKIFSLPKLVDANKEKIKNKYLEYIFNLGESRINGKPLVNFLEIRPNFSYWWMTLLSEKCNAIKSPQIDDAIKLLTFEDWLNSKQYKKIILKSSNKELAEAFTILSNNLGLEFGWEKVKKINSEKKSFIKFIYHILPTPLKALIWFSVRLTKRWNLKGVGLSQWRSSKASTTVFSFLFNLSAKEVDKGLFKSNHWTVLPDVFTKYNVDTNWLHLYNPDFNLPTSKLARNLIMKFNKTQSNNQVHVTLDTFLSLKVIVNVLIDWVFLIKSNLKIRTHIFRKSDFLWPLLRRDYKSSMLGSVALDNLLNLNLFQQALSNLPTQKKGFYLQENQGWEYALISQWRSSNHKMNLVGIPHSTIRYWDLRYFFDRRCYNTSMVNSKLPLPDYIGVNGDYSKEMHILSGYPESQILEVEALRYQYLNKIVMDDKIDNHHVLVLGGKNIANQIQLLNSADSLLNESIKFIIKTDPWNPIKLNDFQKLKMELTTETISKLLGKYNIIYTDNITSAAVDAYCMGKQVISMLDARMLNLSPLLDYEDVMFVSSPEKLAKALNNFSGHKNYKKKYFYLDSNLSRWEKLINGE